jgi:hypothetical protein
VTLAVFVGAAPVGREGRAWSFAVSGEIIHQILLDNVEDHLRNKTLHFRCFVSEASWKIVSQDTATGTFLTIAKDNEGMFTVRQSKNNDSSTQTGEAELADFPGGQDVFVPNVWLMFCSGLLLRDRGEALLEPVWPVREQRGEKDFPTPAIWKLSDTFPNAPMEATYFFRDAQLRRYNIPREGDNRGPPQAIYRVHSWTNFSGMKLPSSSILERYMLSAKITYSESTGMRSIPTLGTRMIITNCLFSQIDPTLASLRPVLEGSLRYLEKRVSTPNGIVYTHPVTTDPEKGFPTKEEAYRQAGISQKSLPSTTPRVSRKISYFFLAIFFATAVLFLILLKRRQHQQTHGGPNEK